MQTLVQILLILLLITALLGDFLNCCRISFDKFYDNFAYDDLAYILSRSTYKIFIHILNVIVVLLLLAFVWLLIKMSQSFLYQYDQLKKIFHCVIGLEIINYFVSLPVLNNAISVGPKNKYHGLYALGNIIFIGIDACLAVALIIVISAKIKGL